MINKSPGAFIALAVVLVLPLWICYGWRIEPESGQIAILLKTTGKDLPPEPSLVGGDAETAFELINRQMEGHGRGRLMMRELSAASSAIVMEASTRRSTKSSWAITRIRSKP